MREQLLGRVSTHKEPLVADRLLPYFEGDSSGRHVQKGSRGHNEGRVDCDIVGGGLGRSPAILRESPHFPLVLKVGVGALEEEDALVHASDGAGRMDDVRALAEAPPQMDVVGSKSEVLRLNRTDRSRQGKGRSNFRLAPRRDRSLRDFRPPISETLERQYL